MFVSEFADKMQFWKRRKYDIILKQKRPHKNWSVLQDCSKLIIFIFYEAFDVILTRFHKKDWQNAKC